LDLPLRTEVTIETHEVLVIRRRGSYPRTLCPDCGEQATMLTMDEAITVFSVSMRSLVRYVEAGDLHFVETPKGALFLCSESLAALSTEERADGPDAALEQASFTCGS
jgi:hypothetical protein